MNALVSLNFNAADVRMIIRDGEPWWVLNDVCMVLEIANPRDAATRLREWQKGVGNADTLGGRQEFVLINEAGLYKLALTSRKPVAEKFEKWLTCDVLPSIRKFGMYPPPSAETIAANDPYDGQDKTIPQRFKEERIRWERETGYSFSKVPGFSSAVIRSIEGGLGGTRKKERVETMVVAGLDVRYILTGARNITPIERGIIDRLRQHHALMLEN